MFALALDAAGRDCPDLRIQIELGSLGGRRLGVREALRIVNSRHRGVTPAWSRSLPMKAGTWA